MVCRVGRSGRRLESWVGEQRIHNIHPQNPTLVNWPIRVSIQDLIYVMLSCSGDYSNLALEGGAKGGRIKQNEILCFLNLVW
jgi:hypothetical protein